MLNTKPRKKVGVIDLRPTPTGYAKALLAILESGNEKSKEWARQDFIRLVKAAATITPESWAKEE